VREAQPRHHAGTELLEHDVVVPEHRAYGRLRIGLLEIDARAPLVAVERQEDPGLVADLRRHVAQVVAAFQVLDLVDLRAQIREREGGEGPWQEPAEIEDADTLERLHASTSKCNEPPPNARKGLAVGTYVVTCS